METNTLQREPNIEKLSKHLGKISNIKFGIGGYQDSQFGVSIQFNFSEYYISMFKGYWTADPNRHCKWTKQDQATGFADTMFFLRDLMVKAKVNDFNQLKGIPVEITLNNQSYHSFRILTEVL